MKKLKFKLKKDRRTALEKEMDRLSTLLRDTDPDSPEYTLLIDELTQLSEIQAKQKPVKEVKRIDPNTVLVVLGGLAEIVLIMSYENLHVLSTKAFGRILRPRI